MKATWQAWIERWLGVDATFLAAAAIHIVLAWVLPWLQWLTSSTFDNPWTVCTGWIASSTAMLGAWGVCGPGRLATRCLWTVLLAIVNSQFLWATNEIVSLITAAVILFAGVVSLASAFVWRLARGIRLMRASTDAVEIPAERWQFRLADLLLFTVVAAIVVAARNWLADFGPLFYAFGTDTGGQILYAVRCGGVLCAATALSGMLLLLRDRPQVVWTILVCAFSTTAAVLLTWIPLDEPEFGSLIPSLRIYGGFGAGSLLATIGTLLPLRAWGWRCVRTKVLQPPKS